MIGMVSMKKLASITEGKLVGENVSFTDVSTDSRNLKAGDLFVALSGENFNGNDYVEAAKERGACGALVSRLQACDFPQVKVTDTLQGLRALASSNREHFTGPMFAVTGSSGKTTVKEMLASVLSVAAPVFYTHGNLNNHIGVPLSLLRLDATHHYAVLELGASSEGEILFNTQLVKPDVAIITNAGEAHLGVFGSREAIVRTKGEILATLKADQCAVLNLDDPSYGVWNSMVSETRVISFSASGNINADVYATEVQLGVEGSGFNVHVDGTSFPVFVPAAGLHNVANALAVAAAAWAKSISAEQIAEGLSRFKGAHSRLQFKQVGAIRVIDDSYNANPSSVCAALEVLAGQPGYRVAILGDMAELGEAASSLHEKVGQKAADLALDQVLAVGEYANFYTRPVGEKGKALTDKEALFCAVKTLIDREQNVVLLVKGSRSAKMETLIEKLEAHMAGQKC